MTPTNPLKPSLAAYDPVLTSRIIQVQRDLSVTLSGDIELVDALLHILKTIARVTDMDAGGIYILDEPTQSLILTAHIGLSPAFISAVERFDDRSANYHLVMRGEVLYNLYNDLPFLTDRTRLNEGLKAIAILPIQHNGKVIACLNMASHSASEISPLTRNILEAISIQIGTAIARLRTEKQLRQSEAARSAIEARYQALVDQSTDGIAICDSNGIIVEWNHALEEITGISRQVALGKALATLSFLLVDDHIHTAKQVYQFFTEWVNATATRTSPWFGKPQEISILRSDGVRKELEALAFAFYANNEFMICIQCRDLTGRREIEKRLRESEMLFRNLVETSKAGIFIVRDGQLIFSNSAISEISGYTLDEILHLQCINDLVPNWNSQLAGLIEDIPDRSSPENTTGRFIIRQENLPSTTQVEFITRAGERRWAEITWGGFELLGSNFSIGIAVDITDQVRSANELAQRNKELILLNVIAHQAGNIHDPDQMIETVRDLLQSQMNVASGEIQLFSPGQDELRSSARWGLPAQDPHEYAPLYLHHYIVRERQLVLVEDSAQPEKSVFKNMVRIPLYSSGEIQGYLDIYNNETYSCCTQEISFLENLGRTVGMFIQNTRLFAQVNIARERFQAFSRRLVRIQEAERRHIARELHDEAGQSLTYILMGLDLLARELSDPAAARERVESLKKVTSGVMEDLHRLATDLRPVGLDRLGLYAMLQQVVSIFRTEFKRNVDFKFNGPVEKRLPLTMETALYRIVQEAFTNIARHSRAHNISLFFSIESAAVKLIIKDDGVGFDPGAASSEGRLGLLGIQERVEMLGGVFIIESTPGKGTILLVEVPLDQKNLDR